MVVIIIQRASTRKRHTVLLTVALMERDVPQFAAIFPAAGVFNDKVLIACFSLAFLDRETAVISRRQTKTSIAPMSKSCKDMTAVAVYVRA